MPPPGGFEAVKYKRNLPFRGPSGLAILGAVTAVCAYGFYRVGKGNLERRYVYLHRQRIWGSAGCRTCLLMVRSSQNVSHLAEDPADVLSETWPVSARARKSAFSHMWTLTNRFSP
ncbi:hypothetical protein J3R82DRAFT_4175 [Butyriboletus roseoflavus]|nr:hypothetical protein J3R82DRAFT_4175 [Butyriboletus roseoflavus]